MWILRYYRYFYRIGTWALMALLVVIMLVANQGFDRRHEDLGPENKLLDGRRWYTPEEARDLFLNLGEMRYYYAITEFTLDLFYPLTYGLLFTILLARLLRPKLAWLLLVPLLTVIFDLLENSLIIYMALTFDGSATPVAWVASVFSLLKSLFFLASLLTLLNAGFWVLVRSRQHV